MNRGMLLTMITGAALLTACNKPHARLNAPPHGEPVETTDMQGTFVYMQDNALLANMTVNDTHFLPHRARLNGAGEERLCRLAALMHEYGGTIRFDSDLEDGGLRSARTQAVIEFLNELGMQATSETVKPDMAGGSGMAGAEAVLIRANEGTYNPTKAKQSSAQTGGGSTSSNKP